VNPIGKKIPVVKDLEADQWIGDSDQIVKYLEEKFPEPKLGTPETTADV
jgi:glutathione S-transferase